MKSMWMEHLSGALAESGIAAYMWDAGEDRFEWAGNLRGLLGLADCDFPRSNSQFHMLLNPQHVPERLARLHELLQKHRDGAEAEAELSVRYRIRRANGSYADVVENATLREDGQTGQKILCGFLRLHESAIGQKEEVAPAVTFVDAGMGHYGRIALQRRMEEWHTAGKEAGLESESCDHSYLLVAGIDRLSLFNEAFGPHYADEVIEKTGQRLRQIAGSGGHVVRIDGDVFGIFFEQAPHGEMTATARYIINNFHDAPLQTSKGPSAMCVSIGGASVNRRQRIDSATILTRAEVAMRSAKQQGRNCFVAYRDSSAQANDTRLLLESGNGFLRALKDNRVRLAFQPIMSAEKESVSFHECLIRLIDEEGRMVSAAQFIPAVEKLGLGHLVDQYALRMAIQELTMFPDLSLSVNVSNLSLTHQDWLRGLVAALKDRPSVARRLIVEITENTMMGDVKRTLRVVRTLQDLGCRVALDDFGAGNTAFSQLNRLDVDMVKIDKSFVRNIKNDHNHLFVRTLQALAEGIEVETVGEGAETMADARLLAGDGVNYIQGYVFGFPQAERVWLPKDHAYRRMNSGVCAEEQVRDNAERNADLIRAAVETRRA